MRSARTQKGEPARYLRDIVLRYDGDDCLEWPFARSSGYGRLWHDGKVQYVSQIVCAYVNGDAPTPKHEVAHNCGNGHLGCVNPRHLRWATHRENLADRVAHKRQIGRLRGSTNKMRKADAVRRGLKIGPFERALIADLDALRRDGESRTEAIRRLVNAAHASGTDEVTNETLDALDASGPLEVKGEPGW